MILQQTHPMQNGRLKTKKAGSETSSIISATRHSARLQSASVNNLVELGNKETIVYQVRSSSNNFNNAVDGPDNIAQPCNRRDCICPGNSWPKKWADMSKNEQEKKSYQVDEGNLPTICVTSYAINYNA